MPEAIANIETYLESVGLRRHRNINQFWSYLDSRYAKTQVGDLERAYLQLERGNENAFYQEIFQNLKVSIDFSSLRHDLYRNFLEWFVATASSLSAPPAVIIDVGCGNGILTCFYAQRFPAARVVGFDVSETGVECAQELANQLGVKNVEFVVADSNDLILPVEKGTADLIVSVASLGQPPAKHDTDVSIYSMLKAKPRLADMIQVSNLAPYLTPDRGLLLSFDKVSTIGSQVTWANIIQKCGLGVDLTRSAWLSYENIEGDLIMLPGIAAGAHIKPCSNDDIVGFFTTQNVEFENWYLDFGREALAEVVFTYVNPKVYIRGARADYTDGSGTYWYELWQAGPFILTFEHTDQGFRTLRVAPSTQKEQLLNRFDDWVEQTSGYAEVKELQKPEIPFQI